MTTLILADVDAGSNTPSMVGGVMSWRAREVKTGESKIPLSRTVVDFVLSSGQYLGRVKGIELAIGCYVLKA